VTTGETRDAVLGVDLGGTVVKAAVVGADGSVDEVIAVPSGERGGRDEWLAVALAAADRALASSPRTAVAAGLSVPGAVDPHSNELVDLVSRLPSAEAIDLASAFAPLDLPVAADNDARAALAAERRWGAWATDNLVVLTLGTGIGGAAMVGGRVPGAGLLGANQLGHLTVELDGEECVCGNVGCAETVASASALVRAAGDAGLAVDGAEAVFDAVRRGDARAAAVLPRFISGLVATIVNAIHAYQPDVVVLAGGLVGSAADFLPEVEAQVARRAWTVPRGRVTIARSQLGARAGVMAGAAVAFDRLASACRAAGPVS
jgi:glucokinase